jgi:putative transposase
MNLQQHKYFHLYNRSNNNELVFKSPENYLYFLKKYRKYLYDYVTTIAYCLMPNHFHFLIYVKSAELDMIKKNIGILLSSYAKAINKSYGRVGSLFQEHSKTKLIDNEEYLLVTIGYIHQNPIRKNLIKNLEDWEFSSYRDYIDFRKGTLIDKSFVKNNFCCI